MIITSFAIILTLSTLLKPLRNGFYLLHILLVVGASWLVETHYGTLPLFSPKAVSITLVLHLLFINLITFFAYAYDKHAARKQAWRVPEKTLLAFALIGGTPAASIARKMLRHKTAKRPFKLRFWLVIIMQVIAILGLIYWSAGQGW